MMFAALHPHPTFFSSIELLPMHSKYYIYKTIILIYWSNNFKIHPIDIPITCTSSANLNEIFMMKNNKVDNEWQLFWSDFERLQKF